MAQQPEKARSSGRADKVEKGSAAGRGEKEEEEERKKGKREAEERPSSRPSPKSHQPHLVAAFRGLFCSGCLRIREEKAGTYFCPICMERKPAGKCFKGVQGCDHVFCAECIAGYVAAKVGENAVAAIRCPEPSCTGVRLEPEACRPVIPALVFERWGAALCEAAVGEAARFYCPYRDCSALLWREAEGEEGSGQTPMTEAKCGHCRRVCCAQCRVPWHEGLTCEEYRKRAEELAETERVMEMARQKKWQRCPKCGFVVERVEGCVFIRCRCNHCFCYRCASPMKTMDQRHFSQKCHPTWDYNQA